MVTALIYYTTHTTHMYGMPTTTTTGYTSDISDRVQPMYMCLLKQCLAPEYTGDQSNNKTQPQVVHHTGPHNNTIPTTYSSTGLHRQTSKKILVTKTTPKLPQNRAPILHTTLQCQCIACKYHGKHQCTTYHENQQRKTVHIPTATTPSRMTSHPPEVDR